MRSRAFLLLFLALFSSTLGIGMVSPILPVVAKELGATGAWVGLSFSSFAVTQVSSTFLFGRWSDRLGRRYFLLGGFLIYGVAGLGFVFATSFYEIIAWRAIAGFGTAAAFPIALAYIGDISPPGEEGSYMGTFNVAQWAGFGIGPALGGVMRDVAGDDGAFLTMALLLFGMALLLPESPRFARGAVLDDAEPEPETPLGVMLRDNVMRGMIAFFYVGTMGFGTSLAFMAVFMEDELGSSPTIIGLVIASRTLVNGAFAPIMGRVVDRMPGRRPVFASVGLMVAAALSFFIGDLREEALLFALFAGIGLMEGIAWPSIMSYSVDAGRPYGMGSVMGVTQTGFGVGILIGSLVGGVIESTIGIETVFRFAAVATVVSAVGVFLFLRRGSPVIEQAAVAEELATARPVAP